MDRRKKERKKKVLRDTFHTLFLQSFVIRRGNASSSYCYQVDNGDESVEREEKTKQKEEDI